MNATVLRDFFLGKASARELAADLEGTTVRTGRDTFRHYISDLAEDFEVTSDHLARVCNAVLTGELDPEKLREIGFGMIASDHFTWNTGTADGARVGNALYDWSSPEINYALTQNTVRKFRHRLLTGEDTFSREDHYTGSKVRSTTEYRTGESA